MEKPRAPYLYGKRKTEDHETRHYSRDSRGIVSDHDDERADSRHARFGLVTRDSLLPVAGFSF
jgi:hypothetical protein